MAFELIIGEYEDAQSVGVFPTRELALQALGQRVLDQSEVGAIYASVEECSDGTTAATLNWGINPATGLAWPPANVCPDCGEPDERRGHQECQGEHWTVKFRRVIRSQVDVIDLICAAGTACRNLVPPLDIDPRQHCISTVCPSSWTDHRATRCLEIQPGRCGCGTCYPEGTPCP